MTGINVKYPFDQIGQGTNISKNINYCLMSINFYSKVCDNYWQLVFY